MKRDKSLYCLGGDPDDISDSPKKVTQQPTFSMQPVGYEDGSWGVLVQVTGLTSKQQAEAAMTHMQKLFCGAEISEH